MTKRKSKDRKKRDTSRVQRIIDAVRDHKVELIATDADGTLYSFWDYFVPAMQKVVPHIASVIGSTDLDAISRELGRVMAKYGTHEHPWTLEETWLRAKFTSSADFRDKIVQPFWAALDRYRTKYLRPFADVRETLTALNQAGIPVVIVSDAPAHMAVVRVTQTGVDELVQGLYALETVEPTADAGLSDEDLAYGRDRVRSFANTPHRLDVFRTMPKTNEKPSPLGLELAMSDFKIKDPGRVLFVGDSLKKDGGVAQTKGTRFIWARYGTNLPAAYKELVDVKFNPDTSGSPIATGHGVSFSPAVLPPMVAQAASYAEVLKHLGNRRPATDGTILAPSATPQATKAVGH